MSRQQLTAMLELRARNSLSAKATVGMMRDHVEAAARLPAAENVHIERVNCGPCKGDLLFPLEGEAPRLIIFYHGGGFTCCSSRTHRVVASHLARVAGCAVLVPDYRLAPENPAPAAHDDAFAVYRWALEGYAPGRMALSGDSSGGNLALATALRAQEAGLPLPCALALMSPWLDLAGEGASHRDTIDDPILSAEKLDACRLAYVGNGDRKSSTVTPFYADFGGLPPTLVHVGSWERLRDDSITLVDRMTTAGVAAELKIFDGMCHAWQMYAPVLDEGMSSIEECGSFVRSHQG